MAEIIIPRRNRHRPALAEFLPGGDFKAGAAGFFGSDFIANHVTSFSRAMEWNDSASKWTASTQGSEVPIFVWAEGTALRWYSEESIVFLNANATGMFRQFESMASFSFAGISAAHATNISEFFRQCSALTTIEIPRKINLYNATDISGMFKACTALQSFDTSVFLTSPALLYMNELFNGCSSLTSAKIAGNFVGVKAMTNLFQDCTSLVSFDFHGALFGNVEYGAGSMFYGCTALEYADLDAAGLALETGSEDWLFRGCTGLKRVKLHTHAIPANSYGNMMFEGCTSLIVADLSGLVAAPGGSIYCGGRMFDGCGNLSVIYASTDFSTQTHAEGTYMFRGCTSLVGGAGTAFDPEHTDGEYARIDNRPTRPGYFTYKART